MWYWTIWMWSWCCMLFVSLVSWKSQSQSLGKNKIIPVPTTLQWVPFPCYASLGCRKQKQGPYSEWTDEQASCHCPSWLIWHFARAHIGGVQAGCAARSRFHWVWPRRHQGSVRSHTVLLHACIWINNRHEFVTVVPRNLEHSNALGFLDCHLSGGLHHDRYHKVCTVAPQHTLSNDAEYLRTITL
jgi:hypothetical protein